MARNSKDDQHDGSTNQRGATDSPSVDDHFDAPAAAALDRRWAQLTPGGGRLRLADSALRFAIERAEAGAYSDAQIDDYSLRGRRAPQLLWRPPLRMEARARASHPIQSASAPDAADGDQAQHSLRGTAGFGFWNYPLSITGAVLRLPDAIWFFASSPPSNMALVPGVPGWGWKAQVVHAHRFGALAAGIPLAGAALRARLTGNNAPAARWMQRVTGAHEVSLTDAPDPALADITRWHNYRIEWRREVARFFVDDVEALAVPQPPQGPLGFVAWIDNQYAIATPRGELGFGMLASGPEWLELDYLRITPLTDLFN
ncbi:MAG: hypothetical protein ABI068_14820 [Ktedonobacterales bacterium]